MYQGLEQKGTVHKEVLFKYIILTLKLSFKYKIFISSNDCY